MSSYSRMKNLISTALLFVILSPHVCLAGRQGPAAEDDAQRVKRLSKILETGSYEEKAKAISELGRPKSERAAKILLKRLKRNLARKAGTEHPPWVSSSGGDTF